MRASALVILSLASLQVQSDSESSRQAGTVARTYAYASDSKSSKSVVSGSGPRLYSCLHPDLGRGQLIDYLEAPGVTVMSRLLPYSLYGFQAQRTSSERHRKRPRRHFIQEKSMKYLAKQGYNENRSSLAFPCLLTLASH